MLTACLRGKAVKNGLVLCLTLVRVYLSRVHRKAWRLALLLLRLCLESELCVCIWYLSFDSFSNGAAQTSACDYFLGVRFKARGSLFSTWLKVKVWSSGVGLVRLWVRVANLWESEGERHRIYLNEYQRALPLLPFSSRGEPPCLTTRNAV